MRLGTKNSLARWGIVFFLLLFSINGNTQSSPTPNSNAFNKPSTQNLTIEADKITYLENNEFVSASGNVLVVYQNYNITASVSVVDTKRDQLHLNHGFVMKRDQRIFKGYELDYNLQTETGRATQVQFNFSGNYIKGKEVIIGKDKIIIYNGVQTACNLEPPHYRVEASKFTIYTRWNLMVADGAVVYLFGVPMMYIPNYVVDNQNQSSAQTIIPEFGSNPIEGDYIKAKLGYHINEKVQGTFDLDYLSNLEYRAGFTNTSLLNNHSSIQTRVHQVGRKGMELGLTYRTLLGVSKEREQTGSVADFFAGILPPSRTEYPELIVDMTHREFINLQTISLAPEVTLQAPAYYLWDSQWYLSGKTSLGNITEENTGTFQKFRIFPTFGTSWTLEPIGTFHENINYDTSTYYSNFNEVQGWFRFYNNFGLSRVFFGFFHSFTNYRHTFDEGGSSPFLYDQFNQAERYEITQEGWFKIDRHRLGFILAYGLESQQYRRVDYFVDIALHEWIVQFKWQTKLNDFRLGFSITTDY